MLTGHVFIATSLDGFIATLDGGIDWLIQRDLAGEDHGYTDFISGMDGVVMGRGTFEKILTLGPWPFEVPVVVLSRSMTPLDIPEDLRGRIRVSAAAPRELFASLSSEGWQRAYVDGGKVIQSFLREKLIDDMVVTRVPVLLGEGRPLFGPTPGEISLLHQKTIPFPSGLVQSFYKVVS